MNNFEARAKTIHADKYTYAPGPYYWHTPIEITCPHHGSFLQSPAKHILRKQGCPTCGKALQPLRRRGKYKHTKDEIIAKCIEAHGDRYDYSLVEWKGTRKKITIVCKLHGPFEQEFGNHVRQKTNCPKCSPSILSYPRRTIDSIAAKVRSDVSVLSIDGQVITLCCPTHGEFTKLTSNIRNTPGCPKCAFKGYSTQQHKVSAYLSSIGIDHVHNYRYGDGKKELDIYIPALSLGIEIDGIYWHSTASPHNKKLSHAEVRKRQLGKKELCTSLGIHLLTLLDAEIDTKFDAVKNILGHYTKTLPRIFARQCIVRKITHVDADAFICTNHMQRNTAASHYYGLYSGESLISVMSFRHRGPTWEIARYVSTHQVVGGFRKLLAAFESSVCPTKLISFCDTRLFTGAVYTSSGFSLEKTYKYNYMFVYKGKTYPREHFMRARLPDSVRHLPLQEAYTALGVATLYLAPHSKYVKTYP